jgi:hypothetical protein
VKAYTLEHPIQVNGKFEEQTTLLITAAERNNN